MKKKNQPGGSLEESSSTKLPKTTTSKGTRKKTEPKVVDLFTDLSIKLWKENSTDVLADTILSKGYQNVRTAGGRYPEDKDWWDKNGPELAANWMRFREHSKWAVWTTPDGRPAIELELNVDVNGVIVKMIIDRIMMNENGELYVIDLKTGKRKPEATLQLGFYRYGLWKTFGISVNKGAWWMARQATLTEPIDLTAYTPEKIEYLIQSFDHARKVGAFIPNTNACVMCGYTMHCTWYVPKEKINE
jgi:hypothetical protein